MSEFAALFEHPQRIRAGYVGEPGTPEHVELWHPCVGCWEEKEIVGAIVGNDGKALIHVEEEPELRCSPASCWTREVESRIAAFERADATVTLVAGGSAS
jgi:hypothetical protein